MRKPVFTVTARCTNPRCPEDIFHVARKQITKVATSGQTYRIERVVCPRCRQWQPIINIEAGTTKG